VERQTEPEDNAAPTVVADKRTVEEEASMKAEDKARVGRRDFLRILGSGAGVAAGLGSFPAAARADSESNEEKRKPRYRETEDVQTYYRVNRYPG
jgi:hypothetical protein